MRQVLLALSRSSLVGASLLLLVGESVGRDTTPSALSSDIIVTSFGAVGDGETDDQPAFMAALDFARAHNQACISVRSGRYVLKSPVYLKGGECIQGENGTNLNGSAVLKPKTSAFQTAKPLDQLENLVIRDFEIVGGTNQIDLGLFHNTHLSNLVLKDYSGWGIVHVRGERHILRNITCWHSTVASAGCISLADPSHSGNRELYSTANWTDNWWDRALIDGVFDVGEPGLSDRYTLWSGGTFSGTNVRWLMAHNAGNAGFVRLNNVQLSNFQNMGTDGVGRPESPVPVVFEVLGYFKYSEINGYFPAFSGSSRYVTGLYFRGQFIGSSVRNCALGGDNVGSFGLRFGTDYGGFGTIESCDGSVFNDHPAWGNFISIVGSRLAPSNIAGSIISERSGNGIDVVLNTPDSGKTGNSSSFKVMRSTPNGGSRIDFEIAEQTVTLNSELSLNKGATVSAGERIVGYSDDRANETWSINSKNGIGHFRSLQVKGDNISPSLAGKTEAIGGNELGPGSCESSTISVQGARSGMVAVASPANNLDPGDGYYVKSSVISDDLVNVKICAAVAGTPTKLVYDVRVIQ